MNGEIEVSCDIDLLHNEMLNSHDYRVICVMTCETVGKNDD
jgi:hypothetical protein